MNEQFTDIIGLTIEEARAKVVDRGIDTIRAKSIDGQPQMVTQDMQTKRLNVSLMNGKISSVGRTG